MRKVKLDDIRIDGGTQRRATTDQERVYTYLEDMKAGDEFPKMFAVFDGTHYWLVDGFHRYHAFRLLNIKEIEIDYKPGTLEEAQVLSFGVNGTHGKPRTNEEKRLIVLEALKHRLTKDMSDRELAKTCKVSHTFVASIRNPDSKERQEKNRDKSAEKKVRKVESDSTRADFAPPVESTPQDGAVPDEDEIREAQLALQADQEAMHKLLESDDALATAHQEIKRLNVLNAQLSVRINGLMNERNEAVKMVKKLQNEVDKLRGKK